MGSQTKIQLISRTKSEQWYVNFPAAIAHAMEFERGEMFEWLIIDNENMVLRRMNPPQLPIKKKLRKVSSDTSTNSGNNARPHSHKKEQASGHEK